MKTEKILDYRVHIEQEKMGRKTVYNAACPALGLADFGDTIDEALNNITSLIKFHIESLVELGRPVPVEKDTTTLITSVRISAGAGFHAAV